MTNIRKYLSDIGLLPGISFHLVMSVIPWSEPFFPIRNAGPKFYRELTKIAILKNRRCNTSDSLITLRATAKRACTAGTQQGNPILVVRWRQSNKRGKLVHLR